MKRSRVSRLVLGRDATPKCESLIPLPERVTLFSDASSEGIFLVTKSDSQIFHAVSGAELMECPCCAIRFNCERFRVPHCKGCEAQLLAGLEGQHISVIPIHVCE